MTPFAILIRAPGPVVNCNLDLGWLFCFFRTMFCTHKDCTQSYRQFVSFLEQISPWLLWNVFYLLICFLRFFLSFLFFFISFFVSSLTVLCWWREDSMDVCNNWPWTESTTWGSELTFSLLLPLYFTWVWISGRINWFFHICVLCHFRNLADDLKLSSDESDNDQVMMYLWQLSADSLQFFQFAHIFIFLFF